MLERYCMNGDKKIAITRKVKVINVQKNMLTVIFDSERVVYSKFMPQGTTINDESYCETKNLYKAIKDQKPRRLNEGNILHNKVTSHSALSMVAATKI